MPSKAETISATRRWVEDIVLKHNLCPFAHIPFRNNRIRYAVSNAMVTDELVADLIDELILLRDADHAELETTLLLAPACLNDFQDYNQFLDLIDALIMQFGLQGHIQVASFHPEYQFADLNKDDVRNYTNRSPYPMFHLLLEDSIEQARMNYADVDKIPDANMRHLQTLGLAQARDQLAACYKHK